MGGAVRGNEHDAMIVDGDLTLDGNLDVLLIGEYVSRTLNTQGLIPGSSS